MRVDRGGPLTEKIRLAPDDGVLELPATEPAWIWVHTCPMPKCECRSALVLATHEGREVLLERGAVVREAWNAGTGYAEVAAKLTDLVVFHIDIDTAEAFIPDGDKPLDLAEHPRIGAITERIDGDLLDSIGRLWYRGKGWADPEQKVLLAKQVKIRGWKRGDMLAWDDACTGVRRDYYVLEGGRLYEAAEMYCPVPDCECGEVMVDFETRVPRGAPPPGLVIVQRSGATKLEPSKNGRDRLEQLWDAFRKRHPRYLARFARRYPTIKNIGARIVATPVAAREVGRNDPCPCGSGKKYKHCCASSSPL